jgi:hypothetical protein
MRRTRLHLAMTALVLVSLVTSARAQGTATSSIAGVVVDSAESVVPGANVSVKSESTGAEFFAVTSDTGAFTVPALNIGTYTVTVTLAGFKTAVLTGVTVSSGTPATVRPRLEIGGLSETVVVQAATEVIQTQSAAVSTTANTKSIRDSGSGIQDQGFRIRDSGSGIQDQGFRIRDSGSGIQDQGFRIRDSGSGIRDQGFRDKGLAIRDS